MAVSLLKGSCLCGDVSYQIEGEALAFYHCHCLRCRKMNGTGHASNIRVQASTVNWLSGKDLIRSYKVPEADRFRNDFCGKCGSPLPRLFANLNLIVLPAGTLDMEPPELETSRIFCDSRAAWSCQDELPAYAEYPTT